MGAVDVERARVLAEARLSGAGRRLSHVRGVARAAEALRSYLPLAEADDLVCAAWLHDIGYADGVNASGFHPYDGAVFARSAGFSERVVSLVAFHTGAKWEATERGVASVLEEFTPPPDDLLDALTWADLTTGPDGSVVSPRARLTEILSRYPPGDPVHGAVSRSRPHLLACAERVEQRLRAPSM